MRNLISIPSHPGFDILSSLSVINDWKYTNWTLGVERALGNSMEFLEQDLLAISHCASI